MADFTISSDTRFRPGTVLYVYPATGGGQPTGVVAVTNATVAANSTVSFTGLLDDAKYVAGPSISGPFVAFQTDPAAPEDGGEDGGVPEDGSLTFAQLSDPLKALLVAGRPHDGANYPERVAGVAFNHWVGPSEPPDFEDNDVWTPTA